MILARHQAVYSSLLPTSGKNLQETNDDNINQKNSMSALNKWLKEPEQHSTENIYFEYYVKMKVSAKV